MTLLEYLSLCMPDECTEVRMTDHTRCILWHERDALRHIDVTETRGPPGTFRARPITIVGPYANDGTGGVVPSRMVWFVTPERVWSVGWSE